MPVHARAITLCLMGLSLTGSPAGAWTWERLDYPGAARTYVKGIGDDQIVGYYAKNGGHGFTYDGSTWTTLDFPGADSTTASGIWQNKIVGYYSMPGWYTSEAGFLYDGQTWQTLKYPGGGRTRATGVYGNRVVGYYEDSDSLCHGFIYDGTGYKSLDYPNIYKGSTYPNGIWQDTIVGQLYAPTWGTAKGFAYDGSNWTTVHPADTFSSWVAGICESNMVGVSALSGGHNPRSFLFNGSTWTWIDCPWGYDRTYVTGISGDRIVGTYRDTYGGPDYSFVLTIPEPASLALLAMAGLLGMSRRGTESSGDLSERTLTRHPARRRPAA